MKHEMYRFVQPAYSKANRGGLYNLQNLSKGDKLTDKVNTLKVRQIYPVLNV